MKIKVSESTGAALDWAVAQCEGDEFIATSGVNGIGMDYEATRYSTNWAQGGPIIEREDISTVFCSGDLGEPRSYWVAVAEQQGWDWGYGPYHEQDEEKSIHLYKSGTYTGPTPLIAAMRCYVTGKMGDEVDIPDELF
jgi:hypothetical protein